MTSLAPIQERIRDYAIKFSAEAEIAARYLALLTNQNAFQRTHLPGHITGSAFIISEDHSQTLLVHHAKLNRWLQPGGHADGDTDVVRVALREATEETGVINLKLLSPAIYDLDIHPIPERKEFPAHDHYDIRFLFRAAVTETLIVSEESHDVRWVALDELERYNPEDSLIRLRDKLSRQA